MFQLRTFSDDAALVTALEACKGYAYFRSLLGVVEIARGDKLEKVYFHVPNIRMYLTRDLKHDILYGIDRSSPIAKVTSSPSSLFLFEYLLTFSDLHTSNPLSPS